MSKDMYWCEECGRDVYDDHLHTVNFIPAAAVDYIRSMPEATGAPPCPFPGCGHPMVGGGPEAYPWACYVDGHIVKMSAADAEKLRKPKEAVDRAKAEVKALGGDTMPDEIWAWDAKAEPYALRGWVRSHIGDATHYRKVKTAYVFDRTSCNDKYPGQCSNCTAGVDLADKFCPACGREFV
jgi:hypothetical protein